ncbi:HNH endonuclease [Ramlibacter sp. 2FC]|uniref:HNH endonuclease n=1 Tax=Ramlibacter sp. 2FC TaxID=2502188 RepID=UPI0010F9CCEA|nr:HNH endonuclease [Ramlibacter sp. 2FC]
MTPLERTRLEKAAADCGFELSPELVEKRLVFRSAQFPESVTVEPLGSDDFALQASEPMLLPVPEEAADVFRVHGWNVLYEVLDKAAATARTMPNRVAQKFHQATATLPKSTEAERLVVQRVGQNLFRTALLDYWQGRCCVTGLAVPELLRASHIKPWAQCDSDEERLDVFNGLLLAPHLDALFDGGWMTFAPDGAALWSAALPPESRDILGLASSRALHGLQAQHRPYLAFHRSQVFRG